MPIIPVIRIPLTTLGNGIMSFEGTKCADRELKAVECVEAYGLPRGEEKCRILMDDFRECISNSRSLERVEILRTERYRQIKAGEREKPYEELPIYDSV